MENWHIVLIVFGSSGTIMFILIGMFKWMSIKIFKNCFCRRKNAYKVEGDIKEQDVEQKACDSLYIIDKSGFSPYLARSNRVSVDTRETCDEDFLGDFNNDSMIIHVKPVLKNTARCSLDLSGQTSIDDELKPFSVNVEVHIELNYNPFQEVFEAKILSFNNLNLDKMFVNCDDIDPNRIQEFDIISATELFQVYYVIWLGDGQMEKKASKVRPFNSRLDLNDDFKWFLEEAVLMKTQVSLVVYILNNTNGFQTPIAQTAFQIQDVYSKKPTRVWLPLDEPDKDPLYRGDVLVSLNYLPTAERLTVVLVEAKNVQFEKHSIIGSSFAKISLLNEKGRMLESFATSVRKDDPNPQFNEVTIFKVKTIDFNRIYLKISLFEIKKNQRFRIGHVYIGPNSQNNHWQNVLRQVRRPVALWHRLSQ